MKRTVAVGLAMGMALVVGACSDSNKPVTAASSSSASPPAITKADFIAKGMQICHKYNVEIPAVGGGAHGDPASRNATQLAIINLLRQNISDLRALGFPPGDEVTLDAIYQGADGALDDVQRTGPHDDIEQALNQTLGPWGQKLVAYGLNCPGA